MMKLKILECLPDDNKMVTAEECSARLSTLE